MKRKERLFFEFDPASQKHGLVHESFCTDLIQVRIPLSETLMARCVSECEIWSGITLRSQTYYCLCSAAYE